MVRNTTSQFSTIEHSNGGFLVYHLIVFNSCAGLFFPAQYHYDRIGIMKFMDGNAKKKNIRRQAWFGCNLHSVANMYYALCIPISGHPFPIIYLVW